MESQLIFKYLLDFCFTITEEIKQKCYGITDLFNDTVFNDLEELESYQKIIKNALNCNLYKILGDWKTVDGNMTENIQSLLIILTRGEDLVDWADDKNIIPSFNSGIYSKLNVTFHLVFGIILYFDETLKIFKGDEKKFDEAVKKAQNSPENQQTFKDLFNSKPSENTPVSVECNTKKITNKTLVNNYLLILKFY